MFLAMPPGLNYASNYRATNRIVVPHKHRVFAYESEKQKVAEPLLVAIDSFRAVHVQLRSFGDVRGQVKRRFS
jgi:hypothetical protein